jgi:hypothetical protein
MRKIRFGIVGDRRIEARDAAQGNTRRRDRSPVRLVDGAANHTAAGVGRTTGPR